MIWWRLALLPLHFAGSFFLYRRLREKAPPLSQTYVSGWKRPWIAIFWMWGPTLWFVPGLYWLQLGIPWEIVLTLSFCLPLVYFILFFIATGVFPLRSSARLIDRLLSWLIAMIPLYLVFWGVLRGFGSELQGFRFALFLASISVTPVLSIALTVAWASLVIPLDASTPGRVRESIRMIIGHFTSAPRRTWTVEDAQVQTRIAGNPFNGTGPGWLLTEPENLVILKTGSRITRIVGPGAVLTEPAESPFKVVDLRNQIRSTKVTAMTRDGVEVRLPISSLFRINRGHGSIRVKKAWPYHNKRDVFEVVFSEQVDPTGKTPLEANRAHPWEELPLRIATQKVKQAVSFYTLDELYQDGHELRDVHDTVADAFDLSIDDDVTAPLTRKALGTLVRRAVKQRLASRGFDIHGGGVGGKIEPVDERVTEKRIEQWKTKFVARIKDWSTRVEQLRFMLWGDIQVDTRARTYETFLDEAQAWLESSHNEVHKSMVAYQIMDSLLQIAEHPDVKRMLPESTMDALEGLSASVSSQFEEGS